MDLYPLIRPLLFRLDPETAHRLTLSALDAAAKFIPRPRRLSCPTEVLGLRFPNPVGLAAGLDKNGDHILGLARLGFGFIEVGTVTPRPQPGNPRPRLFRLPQAQALINRMGFNNLGLSHLVENLKRLRARDFILGVNLGKNRDTPNTKAVNDYLLGLESVYELADYVAINLSSPNTPGLRELQHGKLLEELLTELLEARERLAVKTGKSLPLAVKIAPDLSLEQLAAQAEILLRYRVDAVIATNTTLDHSRIAHLPYGQEEGGVSGGPLKAQSTAMVRQLAERFAGRIPIIACGGILCAEDALAKFAAGASLIQLYTGLIYRGPKLIEEILTRLEERSYPSRSRISR
ncbi:quinone-dependent dihydroorotate dehydrogenase [Methylothermus subterraneus]